MTPRGRDRLITTAKWATTCGLLAVVLWRLPLASLATRLSHVSRRDVVVLSVITTLQLALVVVRWWRLLHGLGERVRYVHVFGDVCVGILYNMLLPGGVGGDVVRALRMRARVSRTHHAWSSSIYERMLGLFAMAVIASLATSVGVDPAIALPSSLRYATLAMTGAMSVAFVFASVPFRLLSRFVGRRLPQAAHEDIAGIGDDLAGPLTGIAIRGEAFAWSLVYQGLNFAFKIACASALGAPGHERAILIGVPIVYVLSALPITVGGHGLREGLYVGVLGALGMPTEVALGLDAAFIISSLFFSLVGAVFLIVDRPNETGTAAKT
jgi:uncharacterized membrane protein YbhN (UPF0104 family)